MPVTTLESKKAKHAEARGAVYCPLCTHTVEGKVSYGLKGAKVVPGQRCVRCSSSLDAGYVIRVDRAA